MLTTRDDNAWLASYRNMLATQGQTPPELNRRRRVLYGLAFPDVTDQQLLRRRRRHEHEVRAHLADRPEHLLEVNWPNGDGWEQLCRFLQRPIPDMAFPHENRGRPT